MNHIKVSNAKTKGKGVFACHAVSVSDILYTTNKLAIAAISTSELENFCYNCYASSNPALTEWYSIGQHHDAKLQVCTGCKVVRFCSRHCQKQAWTEYHKLECKIFAALQPRILPEPVRAVLRFILQRERGADYVSDDLWSDILDSASHMEEMRQLDANTWTDLMLMAKAAKFYAKVTTDENTVLRLMCIVKVNGLTLTTTSGDHIGVFLDPVLVRINHDCDANVIVYRPVHTNGIGWPKTHLNEAMLELLPLRPLAEGEELTISYVEFTSHITRRRQELEANYYFTCTCKKCLQDKRYADELEATKPNIARKQKMLQSEVVHHLHTLKQPPFPTDAAITALTKVVDAIEAQFDDCFSPAMDPYPQAVRELKLLHMDNNRSYDKALIYAFKEYLLVGPAIYSSLFFPTRVINAIYLLQVLALLDNTTDERSSGSPNRDGQLVQQRQNIEQRGFSRKSFKYWRLRICVDTRACLLNTPMKDLAKCLELEQLSVGVDYQHATKELLRSESVRRQAEEEVRQVIGVSVNTWDKLVRPHLRQVEMLGSST